MTTPTLRDFIIEAMAIFTNSRKVVWRTMVRYVRRTMKYTSEKISARAHQVRMNLLFSLHPLTRSLIKVNVNTDAAKESIRSIAKISFELKNLSRCNFVTSFSNIVITVWVKGYTTAKDTKKKSFLALTGTLQVPSLRPNRVALSSSKIQFSFCCL